MQADYTLTFQSPKLSFLLPDSGPMTGSFEVLDIGLSQDFIDTCDASCYFSEWSEMQSILKPRLKFDHKGNYGHAAIIGGSLGKHGAVTLAATSCLKAGSGLVSAAVCEAGIGVLQTSAPEVMVIPQMGNAHLESIVIDGDFTFGIGPGIGTDKKTASALLDFLKIQEKPLVLDADALNILSAHRAWDMLPENSIVTPHPGEFARMTGEKSTGWTSIERAFQFASEHHVIVVFERCPYRGRYTGWKMLLQFHGEPGNGHRGIRGRVNGNRDLFSCPGI